MLLLNIMKVLVFYTSDSIVAFTNSVHNIGLLIFILVFFDSQFCKKI